MTDAFVVPKLIQTCQESEVDKVPPFGRTLRQKNYQYYNGHWDVVVVKWSACSPSTLTIRVQIPLKHTVFSAQFVVKRTKINKKEAGVGPFLEKIFLMGQPRPLFLLFLFTHLQMTKMFLPIFYQFRFKFRINVRSCYLVQLKALPD